jgi:hypothetical protein
MENSSGCRLRGGGGGIPIRFVIFPSSVCYENDYIKTRMQFLDFFAGGEKFIASS